jgi:hypothetical protein
MNSWVSFDDERIVRTLPDGTQEWVRWDDLQEVSILTTDEGPFIDDVFWILSGSATGCAIPSECDGWTPCSRGFRRFRASTTKP